MQWHQGIKDDLQCNKCILGSGIKFCRDDACFQHSAGRGDSDYLLWIIHAKDKHPGIRKGKQERVRALTGHTDILTINFTRFLNDAATTWSFSVNCLESIIVLQKKQHNVLIALKFLANPGNAF